MFYMPQVTEDQPSEPNSTTTPPPRAQLTAAPAAAAGPPDTELGAHGTTSTDDTGAW